MRTRGWPLGWLVAALFVGGCTGGHSAPAASYSNYTLPGVVRFAYPSTWHVAQYDGGAGSGGAALLLVSSNSVTYPCQHGTINGQPVACFTPRPPVAAAASVSVEMDDTVILPDNTFHPNQRVGGRPAQVEYGGAFSCKAGQGQILQAFIPRDSGNYIELSACAPSSDLKAERPDVQRLLGSIRILK